MFNKMFLMRVTFLCCVALLVVLPIESALAPDRARLPQLSHRKRLSPIGSKAENHSTLTAFSPTSFVNKLPNAGS
jgi:hypothetical protein